LILLDTNVVSEVMRGSPDPRVVAWLDAQPSQEVFLSSITIAEIRYGLGLLDQGARRRSLTQRVDRFIELGFENRVLAFDDRCAHAYSELMAARQRQGRPMSMADGQIASIAATHHLEIATRDRTGFAGLGIGLLDPWAD
jgi:predicted nucleic acid-binding protein